jgi:hypothetical protein
VQINGIIEYKKLKRNKRKIKLIIVKDECPLGNECCDWFGLILFTLYFIMYVLTKLVAIILAYK